MSLDLLGAEESTGTSPTSGYGGIVGPILQAAGELAKGGISMYEQKKEKERVEGEEKSKLAAAIQADAAATSAAARADVSAQGKLPSASVDASAAAALAAKQDRLGSDLSAAAASQRASAAETALEKAVEAARKKPKDAYLRALVKAWTATVNKANSGGIVASDAPKKSTEESGPSWFTKPAIGPVPGWGVALGGAGVLGLIAKLALKK